MKRSIVFAIVLAAPAMAWAASDTVQNPQANTNAFAQTPSANTNAFSQTPQEGTKSDSLGTNGPGQVTGFGKNGRTTTAAGNPSVGAKNQDRMANAFGTDTDHGASPVGGHDQSNNSAR